MNAEELDEYGKLLCLIDEGACDGADIYEFEAFALMLVEKYGSAETAAIFGDDVQVWEHGIFNNLGMFGPNPRVGTFTSRGWMVRCRDMTKAEQLAELFPATRSDWEGFRAWLAQTNPLEMRCLDRWCNDWQS